MKRQILVAVLCVAGFAIGLTLLLYRLPARRAGCELSVTTIGITNDASGARHAIFRITNVGRHGAWVLPPYALQNRSGKWRAEWIPRTARAFDTNFMGVLPSATRTVPPGGACVTEVVLPFDDRQWRATFFYMEQQPVFQLPFSRKQIVQLTASTSWADQANSNLPASTAP